MAPRCQKLLFALPTQPCSSKSCKHKPSIHALGMLELENTPKYAFRDPKIINNFYRDGHWRKVRSGTPFPDPSSNRKGDTHSPHILGRLHSFGARLAPTPIEILNPPSAAIYVALLIMGWLQDWQPVALVAFSLVQRPFLGRNPLPWKAPPVSQSVNVVGVIGKS